MLIRHRFGFFVSLNILSCAVLTLEQVLDVEELMLGVLLDALT